jgi:hypothetical protein
MFFFFLCVCVCVRVVVVGSRRGEKKKREKGVCRWVLFQEVSAKKKNNNNNREQHKNNDVGSMDDVLCCPAHSRRVPADTPLSQPFCLKGERTSVEGEEDSDAGVSMGSR